MVVVVVGSVVMRWLWCGDRTVAGRRDSLC